MAITVSSQSLVPHHVSGEIRVTAPNLHFLTGASLSRLRDGAAVPFDFQLVIVTDPTATGSEERSGAIARTVHHQLRCVGRKVCGGSYERFPAIRHAAFGWQRRVLVPG